MKKSIFNIYVPITSQEQADRLKQVCEGCKACWNYLNDETSNCQGQELDICHEFNEFNPNN